MFFSVVCVVILVVVAHFCTGCRRGVWCFLISHSQADFHMNFPVHLCIIQSNGELNIRVKQDLTTLCVCMQMKTVIIQYL